MKDSFGCKRNKKDFFSDLSKNEISSHDLDDFRRNQNVFIATFVSTQLDLSNFTIIFGNIF